MRKEACPIQVMQNSPGPILGKRGTARSPERLVNRDGMRTSAKKFRRCQSMPGFKVTRVDVFFSAPSAVACRTTRVFLKKESAPSEKHIKSRPQVKKFCRD